MRTPKEFTAELPPRKRRAAQDLANRSADGRIAQILSLRVGHKLEVGQQHTFVGRNMNTFSEEKTYKKCPVCNFAPLKLWREKEGGGANYKMDICDSCGYSFVNPRPTYDFLMDFYSTLGHGHSGDGKGAPTIDEIIYKEEIDPGSTIDAKRIVKTLKPLLRKSSKNRFLDVGCGYGFFSREALNAGFTVSSLELADTERGIAAQISGVQPVASSFEEYKGEANSLEVVLMSQILEHVLDINEWVAKAKELLVDDGMLVVALPNFGSLFRRIMQEKEPYISPPMHLNYFSPNSLSKLLGKHGFKVEKIQWISTLPKSTFEKRVPKFGKPFLPLIGAVASIPINIIDLIHLGSIINIYGRKVS